MRKSLLVTIIALLMLAPQAFARVTTIDVTRANQKEMGLDFSLDMRKVSGKMYSVEFNASKSGKLETCRGASLVIYDGEQLVLSVPIKENPDAGDKNISVKFSLHQDMLDKCVLSLMCSDVMIHTAYSIHLATYLPDAQP